jgi:hypothetical protein
LDISKGILFSIHFCQSLNRLSEILHGVDYYFVEATSPEVVTQEGSCFLGGKLYEPCANAYKVDIYLADSPLDANDLTGDWSTDFRLTKPDLDKLNTFKSQ